MLLGVDWCYRGFMGELVLLVDITGGTGATGGMQRAVMAQCNVHPGGGELGFGSPAEDTASLGVTHGSA